MPTYSKNLVLKTAKSIYKYCIYRIKSIDEHGVHSPFVFDLVTNVIYNSTPYYAYQQVERLREELMDSGKLKSALSYQKSAKYGQLLFRLVDRFQPVNVLEVGTAVGLDTAYLAKANSKVKILSVEEKNDLLLIAEANVKQLKLANVELVNTAQNSLSALVNKHFEQLGFLYVNISNAQKVLRLFNESLSVATESSIFIFSDMYSSSEMEQAWAEIKNHPRVTVTVDLFYLGIVFFRTEQVKQHFLIRF